MSLAETAASPLRKLELAPDAALATTLHCWPFQCSIEALATYTSELESAATAFSTELGTPVWGGARLTTLHALPFQCSTSACWTGAPPGLAVVEAPTAQTSDAVIAATPFSWPLSLPRSGAGAGFQVLPFQCSISACVTSLALD